jgi:hypothetical protein
VFLGHQINIYAHDVEACRVFYTALGFVEGFCYAPAGEALHVELSGAGLTLGIAQIAAARAEHGLAVSRDGSGMELVLWCEDASEAFRTAVALGATALSEPHEFQDGRLRVAWVADPAGHPIQLVQDTSA